MKTSITNNALIKTLSVTTLLLVGISAYAGDSMLIQPHIVPAQSASQDKPLSLTGYTTTVHNITDCEQKQSEYLQGDDIFYSNYPYASDVTVWMDTGSGWLPGDTVSHEDPVKPNMPVYQMGNYWAVEVSNNGSDDREAPIGFLPISKYKTYPPTDIYVISWIQTNHDESDPWYQEYDHNPCLDT